MRRLFLFGLVAGLTCSAFGEMPPVAGRVAKQDALFEEFYQAGLKNFPERATAFGDLNDAMVQTEADRYIAWPGQALAYKMGQLTILKLRDEAKAKLGDKFDIKAFHDEILNDGSMPLELLQQRVEAWIKDQKLKT